MFPNDGGCVPTIGVQLLLWLIHPAPRKIRVPPGRYRDPAANFVSCLLVIYITMRL